MDHCAILTALLAKFEDEGNEAAATGIRIAMAESGCTPQTDSGGTGTGGGGSGGGGGGGGGDGW